MNTLVIPPGIYYLGDPLNIVSLEIISKIQQSNNSLGSIILYPNDLLFYCKIPCGIYKTSLSRMIAIDSGIISLRLVEYLTPQELLSLGFYSVIQQLSVETKIQDILNQLIPPPEITI